MRYLGERHIDRMVTLLVTIALLCAIPLSVSAQPAAPGPSGQQVDVSLRYDAPSVAPTGVFELTVRTTITVPAEYFEVRVRLRRPSGALLYQKTEVRHDVESGQTSIAFERDLADLGIAPGRYPVEVRVLASGAEQTLVDSRLLVVDETTPALPLVVVARLTCTPALDPSGRFALDPETHDMQRRTAEELMSLASGRSESLTVAIPPLLLEEWSRIAAGYQLSGPEGVVDVAPDADVPRAYAATLDSFARAAQTGRLELLDVPYAEPDLGGLQQIQALDDLTRHYALGRSIFETVLGTDPSSGTAIHGDIIPSAAAATIARTDHGYFLCSTESLAETVTPGGYRERETGIVALVTDPTLSSLLTSGTAEAVYDRLYDRAVAEDDTGALVVTLDIGPGQDHDVDDVRRLLAIADSVSWLEAVPAARAAQLATAHQVDLVSTAPGPTTAPERYWDEVSTARRDALGLIEALGPADPEGAAALSATLVAESGCWAGPDGSYPFGDRGRAFSASVTRLAEEVFGAIHIEMRDVTLAARAGDVPLTIVSTGDRSLVLRVETAAGKLAPRSTEATILVEPADNFLTIPVDLGTAVSDTLDVRVLAGDVLIAETSVNVKASYLDRLTVVATVIIILIVLLLFIRRRVKAADAGNMPVEGDEGPQESPDQP